MIPLRPGRFFILLALITGISVILATVARWPAAKPIGKILKDEKNRQAAPDFELKDAGGKLVHLSD